MALLLYICSGRLIYGRRCEAEEKYLKELC